jgi:hypothetical protein
VSWDHRFSVSIPLPSGQSLISLRDAGTYITKLPKPEHDAPACKQPILEGRLNLHSSGVMMQALARNEERVFDSSRKTATWRRSNKRA